MKKIFAIALTAMMALTFTACSSNDGTQASTTPSASAAAVVTPSQTMATTPDASEAPAEVAPALKEQAEAAVAAVDKFLSGGATAKDAAAEIEAIQKKIEAVQVENETYEQQSLRVNIESEMRLIHTKLMLTTGEGEESVKQEIEEAKNGINELLGK